MSDTTKETPTTEDLMGYETAVAPVTLPETKAPADTQTLINEAVKEVTVDDNGKYVYPENMDPMLKAAVAATKSYRDNQSGFTKSQQSLKETEAENVALKEQLASSVRKPLELSTEDQTALDLLYTSDPQAWRAKMNMLEQQSADAVHEELTGVTDTARQKAGDEYELQRRYEYLDTFNEGRETPITPDTLDNEVPPRITQKLAKGEVTFEEYLAEVDTYLSKGKTVSKETPADTTDLNTSNGSATPSDTPQKESGSMDYSQTTF